MWQMSNLSKFRCFQIQPQDPLSFENIYISISDASRDSIFFNSDQPPFVFYSHLIGTEYIVTI